MRTLKIAVTLTLVVLLFAMVACSNVQHSEPQASRVDRGATDVLEASREVVEALEAQDGKRLAALVHPQKGVRFSPSAYVDVARDLIFSRTQVQHFWADNKIYTWGFADGTGDPINATPSQYCGKYIMDRSFLNPTSINVNSDRARGNTNNNAASVYSQGTRVEYYIEPSPGEGAPEFDWVALRLVFERSGGFWFLVAVIHDEWTT